MKILILSFTSGWVSRGAETFVRQLSRKLEKQHSVTVINAVSLTMPMVKFTVKALQSAAAKEAEIIMPVNGGWQVLLVRLYCWLTGKKMAVAGLAGLGWCDGWNLLMRPDIFIASTKRNYQWSKQLYGKGVRVEIIPHGVDLERFKPEGKKRRINLQSPIILCVAGPNKYKRVEATIKAVSYLEKGSLLLVGGSDEDELLGEKLLGKRFKRLQARYDELAEIYRVADVFTMVSESTEEFGIVYLEALASGLPIVGTDDELRRELLGKYGIYVQDVWGKEYAEKLQLALQQPKCRPDKWLERFSWNRIAKQYEAVFSLLADQNKDLV